MSIMKAIALAILAVLIGASEVSGCTSAIIAASATADGRPIIWKNRDTSASSNFLARVEAPGRIGYVGLFNSGDTLATDEAWLGMNDAGFAIINTVAYNLPANDPSWADREGYVMADALGSCTTVDDFEELLRSLPKPMGVRTCFGVLDAAGRGAYFETDDSTYTRYDLADSPSGVMIRTNYAYSGTPDEGMGYIRHTNAETLLRHQTATHSITPASLTETLSRSYYNSVTGFDAAQSSDSWTVDQDFIPRYSTTASVAIEGIKPGEEPSKMIMWANVAYPPCSHTVAVTLDSIPAEVRPLSATDTRTPAGVKAQALKDEVFPIKRGNGPKYILLDRARSISAEEYEISLQSYSQGESLRCR